MKTCLRCKLTFDEVDVPFWGGVCWPCYSPDERSELKERILHGLSITDKAYLLKIEQYEVDIEGGPPRMPHEEQIDFLSSFQYRYIKPKKRRRGVRK